MRQALAVLFGWLAFTAPVYGQSSPFPDGATPHQYGGLVIIRQGNQTTFSLGGVLVPRRVKIATATPEGPVVTRFMLQSTFNSPHGVPIPQAAPAFLQVAIPDDYGLVYVEDSLVRSHGTTRKLQCPDLPPGVDYSLRVRGVFKAGDNLLIQDKQVVIRVGESVPVAFDGSDAIAVRLPEKSK